MQDGSFPIASQLHREVTAQIIAAIEAGADEYVMPWHARGAHGRPINAHTGSPYHGGNVVALWAAGMLRGYRSAHWATYRQWNLLGAQVKKGERASRIIFYRVSEAVADEAEAPKQCHVLIRSSAVFNADQVEGWQEPELALPDLTARIPAVDAAIEGTGAVIRYGFDHAAYRVDGDWIEMPEARQFTDTRGSTATEAFYATLFHELTHWTGAAHRLDRPLAGRFNDPSYATEELIAELGAAFLCADLGITNSPRSDHAAYLSHWLQILTEDGRALFKAARAAEAAAEHILGRCDTVF